MHRRAVLGALAATAALSVLRPPLTRARATEGDWPPVEYTEEDWKALLDEDRYRILFEEATERAFTSPLNDEKRTGTYVCAACFLPLFRSEDKYDSGTGWPSFTRPIEGRLDTKRDFKLILPRTEYHCARCDGHQGHVFEDGPRPTGQRWCNNGLALRFVPEGEPLPALRG
jgi:peptide-methionine (R)-S-oxide reductase